MELPVSMRVLRHTGGPGSSSPRLNTQTPVVVVVVVVRLFCVRTGLTHPGLAPVLIEP